MVCQKSMPKILNTRIAVKEFHILKLIKWNKNRSNKRNFFPFFATMWKGCVYMCLVHIKYKQQPSVAKHTHPATFIVSKLKDQYNHGVSLSHFQSFRIYVCACVCVCACTSDCFFQQQHKKYCTPFIYCFIFDVLSFSNLKVKLL